MERTADRTGAITAMTLIRPADQRQGLSSRRWWHISPLAWLPLLLIRVYQWTLSPLLGATCRFEPSCSRYAAECLRRFGLVRGAWLAVRRLLRCHPFHPGGNDPPPERWADPPAFGREHGETE